MEEAPIKDYAKFLRNLGAVSYRRISKPHYKNGVLVSAGGVENVQLPPNNCLFDISKAKPLPLADRLMSASSIFARAAKGEEVLPKNLNWAKMNRNITPVVNQYLCGCCWAVSIATAIADKFVVANLINFNPKISWSYLITCWVNEINLKCGGSNPFLALQWVKKNGVGTDALPGTSFHWCANSRACNPPKSDIKRKKAGAETIIVPKCVAKNKKGVRFYIQKVRSVPLEEEVAKKDESAVKASILSVKTHIQKHGPTVGGYSVYPNFLSGDFTCGGKNPDNIYLENVDYKTQKHMPLKSQTIGTHAVVLVGWGVGKVSESLLKADGSPDKKIDVDYWVVRNSWGAKWGALNGFFHIAMYPINKKSQFDVSVYFTSAVEDPNTGVYSYKKIVTSGILLFEPSYFGEGKPPHLSSSVESYSLITPKAVQKIQKEQRERAQSDASFFLQYSIIVTLLVFLMILLGTSAILKTIKHDNVA